MIFGKYTCIDAHCHIYPERIASRAVHATDNFYGLRSFGEGTAEHLLSEGDRTGIDGFVVQSVASSPHQVESINRFIAETVKKAAGRLTGLGTLHPDSTDLEGDIRLIKAYGLHGVKLHPDIQNFKIDDARALKIYEICEREGLPILMHAGDSRYDRSNPNRLRPIMEIYDRLVVVAAHLGGWSMWDDAVRLLSDLPNLYVDSSSSFAFMTKERARDVVTAFGCDRVLFGTDYPMWQADNELLTICHMGFTEEENQKIFSENARRVFKIE